MAFMAATSRVRRLRHAPARLDEPALARKGPAREAGVHPVRGQNRRRRPEVGRRNVADRVTRVLVYHELPRALQGLEQALGVLEWAQLVGLARDAQIRHADFLGVSLPGERPAEFVEALLVGESRHVHEALLEGRRRLLEDRVAARLQARGRDGDRAVARLVGGRSEEHTSELQSPYDLVCRLLLEKKKNNKNFLRIS